MVVDIHRPVPPFAPFARDLYTAGVTGTNGKTSTTLMIASIFRAAGLACSFETTLGRGAEPGAFEPREGISFSEYARLAAQRGASHLAIEVTSEALARGWAKTWRFDCGIFTNLSRDHLDAHGSFEHYLASKAQLFIHLGPGRTAVLNASDPASVLLDRVIPPDVQRSNYASSSRGPAGLAVALSATSVSLDREGTHVTLEPSAYAEAIGSRLHTPLIGAVFGENALAAALAGLAAGVTPKSIVEGLASLEQVPGRFEVVSRHPFVAVDYAHTPDALARITDSARRLAAAAPGGRLIVVFGAGGDRDSRKRQPMGEAVGQRADYAIITNDNPRSEDPRAIARALEAGCRRGGRAHVRIVLDRRSAIHQAIDQAASGDIVLLCGKGHETEQTLGTETTHFDDREVARELLRGKAG